MTHGTFAASVTTAGPSTVQGRCTCGWFGPNRWTVGATGKVWCDELRGEPVMRELLHKAYGLEKVDVAAIVEQLKGAA